MSEWPTTSYPQIFTEWVGFDSVVGQIDLTRSKNRIGKDQVLNAHIIDLRATRDIEELELMTLGPNHSKRFIITVSIVWQRQMAQLIRVAHQLSNNEQDPRIRKFPIALSRRTLSKIPLLFNHEIH